MDENAMQDPVCPIKARGSREDAPLDRPVERQPVTGFVCGRGRVGETVLANTLVQFCRQHGARLEVWNSDRQNETHSLNVFHADASQPATDDPEEKRLWFEGNLDRQVRGRFDAVMDMAGGDPMVRYLGRDIQLVRTMERRGVRSVAWHVLGPDAADLDYLRFSMEGGLFMPAATLLVINTGLVGGGRAVEKAFDDVCSHPVVIEAVEQGAKLVWFPKLICMSVVSEQGLSFDEAMRGTTKPGYASMSFTDEARVEIFWKDHVPAFFAEIPPDWLPSMPGWRAASLSLRNSPSRGGA